jgi:AraC-like DNA-binding protein
VRCRRRPQDSPPRIRRTLRRAAHAYLRAIRLQGAREDLTNARGRDLRVTDVAMRWGFEHLGRFALAYRDFFGELPSAHVGLRARHATRDR